MLAPWKKSYDKPKQHVKKQRHYFPNKGPYSQSYGFFNSYVQNVKVGPQRRLKAEELMFWTVMLEKTLESPLDFKEIKPVNPKGNQSWIFIRRTDGEAEAPILWPPDAKSWLTAKDPDAGKDWRREEKGTTEDKIVGWHHRLNGHEFEQASGDGEGQGACHAAVNEVNKESDRAERLSGSNNVIVLVLVFRACYVEWSQSENEKQILYINAYTCGI